MKIEYKEGININPKKMDILWEAIGWRLRGEKKWKEILSKSSFMYTAWDRGKLIGTGRIMEDGIMCMFYDICVHPNYQHRRIGSRILRKLIDKIKGKGYHSIGLFAWENNPASIAFYEKFGFVKKTTGMELERYMKHNRLMTNL